MRVHMLGIEIIEMHASAFVDFFLVPFVHYSYMDTNLIKVPRAFYIKYTILLQLTATATTTAATTTTTAAATLNNNNKISINRMIVYFSCAQSYRYI